MLMKTELKIPAGFKRTAIGDIPKEWEVKTLIELSLNGISNGVFNDQNKVGKGYRLINVVDLYDEPAIDTTQLSLLELEMTQFEKNKVKKGDLFFTRSSIKPEGIAFCNICLEEADDITYDGHIMKITPNNELIEPLFLRTYCIGFEARKFFMNRSKRSTMSTIGQEDIADLNIPIPPLPEQRAIASVLSKWDDAIYKTQQLIAQLKQRNNWLTQQLLTGEKRLKGFENSKWKEVKMKEIFERVTRKNIELNTNVVTISAQRGFVRQVDYFTKVIASDILDNYFLVERGEFCYNKSYSNGYPWGATKRLNDFDKAVVTTLYICFKLTDQKNYSGDFFEQFLEANSLDKGLMKIAHEGGRAHGLLNVTPTDFFNLKISIPATFDEQSKIALIISRANNEVRMTEQKLLELKEQKKGLMQQLLTGKKRVPV